MKILILLLSVGCAVGSFAQTNLNKVYPVVAGQKISLRFDYPELVRVTTWDKNEVAIAATVSINNGENDEAFELRQSVSDNTVIIKGQINNMKQLPQRITVNRNGQKMMFKSKADYKKYTEERGRDYNTMSWGADIDIVVEVKVPRNIETRVESVYGMVEIKDFSGPITVDATYGGVDAALREGTTGELTAETNYGQIYTNLDMKFTAEEDKHHHSYVSAKPGRGPRYSFESKYGNVYLRKQN
jgi:hypothetical protein